MKTTYMAKTEEVQRKWYVLDATDKPLGRLAAEAARLLRGKHKPTFTPHVDTGDFVIVVNAEKAILTGNKLQDKLFRYHTGYPGGLKSIKYEDMMSKKPEQAIEKAITGMLPHNRLGAQTAKKLKVYQGEKHPHEAQMPEAWNF